MPRTVFRSPLRFALILLSLIPPMAARAQSTVLDPLAPAVTTRSPFPDPVERLRLLSGHGSRPAAVKETGREPDPYVLLDTEDDFDLRYTFLDIDIRDTGGRRVSGKVTHRVESAVLALNQVVLNLAMAFTVDSVRVDGLPATFTHGEDLVRINLPSPLSLGQSVTVRVAYRGQPPQGNLGLRFDSHNGLPFVWNLSEPDAGSLWWPCKDHPYDKADSADIRITCPDWMTATSNGRLVSAVVEEGAAIYQWHSSYPIASYLISVAAGAFSRLPGVYPIPGGGSMPLEHFVFPEQVDAALVDFDIAVPAIDAFAERFGPYPFLREKYGVTVFGWAGAMEHQTNTSYGWFLINGQHYFDYIYVHELAHMWFGDNITCATWADTWLNEGFASWCEAVWQEELGGLNAYRDYMVHAQPVSDPSGPLYNFPDPFDGNTIYNKGSWVVHMLRGALGDEAFFAGLALYRDLYQDKNATTEDFRAVMESSSGRDLGWFFDEWVYGVNRPHYAVSSMAEPIPGGQRVFVHLDQTQTDAGYFTMPVQVRITGGGTHDFTFWNDPDHEDFVVDLPAAPTFVAVDPNFWILRTVSGALYGLNLVSSDLPAAEAGTYVEAPLVARGGTAPYQWALVDPAPPGILLNAQSGVLSGVPGAAADYIFRVRVLDSASPAQADTARIFWTIRPATSGNPPLPALTARSTVRAVPNPGTGSVVLSFRSESASGAAVGDAAGAAAGEAVEWTAFDLSGRQVASARTEASLAILSWNWDGRDEAGHLLSSGVYWIRARQKRADGSERAATGQVFFLR